MGNPAVNTAVCQCTFGAAPAPLTVTSQSTAVGGSMPFATIMDIPKPPMTFVQQSCKSHGCERDRSGDGCADSHAVYSGVRGSLGAGFSYGDCGRQAGAE